MKAARVVSSILIAFVLCACSDAVGPQYLHKTIAKTSDGQVDVLASDSQTRLYLVTSGMTSNDGHTRFDSSWCPTIPADTFTLLSKNLSAYLQLDSVKKDPAVAGQAGWALRQSALIVPRASTERLLQTTNESNCAMYHANAITPRQFSMQSILNRQAIIALSGMDHIVQVAVDAESLQAKESPSLPPPSSTVPSPARASTVKTPGEPSGDPRKSTPAHSASVVLAVNQPPDGAAFVLNELRRAVIAKCIEGGRSASACEQEVAGRSPAPTSSTRPPVDSGNNGAKRTTVTTGAINPANQRIEPAHASTAPSALPSGSSDQVKIAAIQGIVTLVQSFYASRPQDLACEVEAGEVQAVREACGLDANAMTNPNAPVLTGNDKTLFVSKRLFIQVSSPDQLSLASQLNKRISDTLGNELATAQVEIRPTPPKAQIRWYPNKGDPNDSTQLAAATRLQRLLTPVMGEIAVVDGSTLAVAPKTPGLLELWIPAGTAIQPAKFTAM